jgi:predicted nuclease with RNAse H fold
MAWIRACDDSSSALSRRDLGYFVDLLPPSQHLRVLRNRLDEALYLDIETTGLSPYHCGVTVIGALFKGVFHQWVWPQALDGLWRLLSEAELVVTYNGRRFDVPFLQHHMAMLPMPRAHVDLRYVASHLGITGGQKAVEEHLKLRRPKAVDGLDGFDAVVLWCDAVYGRERSLRRLLAYNRADCEQLKRIAASLLETSGSRRMKTAIGHKAATHSTLRRAWTEQRPTLTRLLDELPSSWSRTPRVVGIDLRGNPRNPTGWVLCEGSKLTHCEVKDDQEIFSLTMNADPDLISIDAPLALPRGRKSAFDDSPCRRTGGIVRDAERILWSRGIGVYPALIPHMQGLTARGIQLASDFREEGLAVIESYPGAAQDILGIPRKKRDLSMLRKGLAEFGFKLSGQESHDELDAITSALVGYFYLADQCEGLGAEDECYLMVPRWTATKSWPRQ